ncbi:MAG: N-acetylglucosamine-specific PTS transporter subunit IIBC [Elusimicrobiota bacterium]|jgi:PTS system N-acetylglucosamine-specific IIC component|nr:N-acetylglucosamine-specific PTS transporter subunit IIBC [Elusimicrobiota bacterium]
MENIMPRLGAALVKLGKSLMLPIAVLPIAGLLLRLGQPDMLNILFVAEAGNAIFNNLPVIFALGVAMGFAEEAHGAAVLSAFVGYLVMTAGMRVFNADLNMGVFGGIIMGITAGLLYNKYKNISLPAYVAFFGGRRFVPIITGLVAIIYAVIFSYIWPPLQSAISGLGNWIIDSGEIGLFSWGVANRLLLPLGLHHILNNLVYFQFGDYTVVEAGVNVVKNGDLWRFFAGDPTAGSFMAGFFPVMMFGLPAACLAMVLEAYKENRKAVAGILLSAALTSFLTGITEPIEFSFMFLAFPLYVLHAILTGISMVVMSVLDIKLGYTFSAGLFDYLLNFGISTHALRLIPVGLVYGVIYFFVFRFAIRKWNLKTPGRESKTEIDIEPAGPLKVESTYDAEPQPTNNQNATDTNRACAYLAGLGGAENIKTFGACTTRLRLEVHDSDKVDAAALKAAGASGVINAKGNVQVVVGTQADMIADEIRAEMKK